MSTEQKILDTIDDYLNGLLTDAEQAAVEKKIGEDADFATKVEEARRVNAALHFSGLAALRQKVGQEIKTIPSPKKPLSTTAKYGIGVLSLALVVSGYFLTKEDAQVAPEVAEVETPATTPVEPTATTPTVTSTNKDEAIATPEKEALTAQQSKKTVQEKTSSPVNETPSGSEVPAALPKETASAPQPAPQVGEKQNTLPEAPKTPLCDQLFVVATELSCRDKATGSIEVLASNKEGNTFFLTPSGMRNTTGRFKGVAAGNYSIAIQDSAGCTYTEKTIVSEKWCPLNKTFSFNPNYGDVWKIQHYEEDNGTFSILSATGKVIFTGTFGGGKGYWEGINSQGQLVPMGNYLGVINYDDGRKETVQLTIIQ